MTTFSSRFRLFLTGASLGLPLLTSLILLPTEAISAPTLQSHRLSFAADEQQTVEVPSPRGSNPLAPSELNRGMQIAGSSDQVKRAITSAAGLRRPRLLEQQLAPVQPLYAQRHSEDKNADPQSRKADVYYYNYSTNEAIRVVVDLNANAVLETKVTRGVTHQPFFTGPEIKAALELIYNHETMGPRLREAYQETTGQSLDDISQINAQGGIFFPASAANTPLGDLTADCELNRCMQLFIPIDDANFIDTSNLVVDLSTGQILWAEQGLTKQTHQHNRDR